MKKFKAICCSSSDVNAERPRPLERRSKKKSSKPSSSGEEASNKFKVEQVWANKHRNSYTVSDARFMTDDEPHNVVISFEGEKQTKMKLVIDDEIVYVVETEGTLRGKLEIDAGDGMVIDFLWDLVELPKKFSFYTREFKSNTRNFSRGSLEEEIAYYQDPWQFSYNHIHALEILI